MASLHLSPVAMVTPVAAMIQVAVLVVDAHSARLAWVPATDPVART